RAAHIIGSQPMTSSGLTCWATQVVACLRADATAASAPPLAGMVPCPAAEPFVVLPWVLVVLPGVLGVLPRVTVAGTARAAKRMAASRSASSARNHGFSSRRFAHSRNVVASTMPQEGSAAGRRAGVVAAGRVAGAISGRVAGAVSDRTAGAVPGWAAGAAGGGFAARGVPGGAARPAG